MGTAFLFNAWMKWSEKIFEKADAIASLDKAKDEIGELQAEFQIGRLNEKTDEECEEFVDIIMCILHCAKKRGYDAFDIIRKFDEKFEKNKKRSWKLNPNNTYSHIK